MTEVEYGGGGHRTRLRNDHEDQLVCHGVPPAPVYKGGRGEVRSAPGVGLPPLALLEKEGGRGREKEESPPPFLVLFGLGGRGRAACPGRPSSSPLGPM